MWPRGFMERLMYVIFYPFYVLYWLVMPNIMHNPEIIKVTAHVTSGIDRHPFQLSVLHRLCLLADKNTRRPHLQLCYQASLAESIQRGLLQSFVS